MSARSARPRTTASVVSDSRALPATAASIKANGCLSYADAFCIATALERDEPLWTGNPEILALAGALPREVVDLRS